MTDNIGRSPAPASHFASTAGASDGRDLFRAAHIGGKEAEAPSRAPVASGWAKDAPAAPSRQFSSSELKRLITRVSDALYEHGNVRQLLKT